MNDRNKLLQRRPAVTFAFDHEFEHGATFHYKCTVGYFASGALGEIFLNNVKHDTGMDAIMQDAGMLASIALQYGAPLPVLVGAVRRDQKGYPASPLGMALDEIVKRDLEGNT